MANDAARRLALLPRNRLICEFSLWSADLVRLADDVARIEPFADMLHVDVADGHFAPAFLFFPDQIARVRTLTDRPIHVHLMVHDSILLSQIEQFAEAGADLVTLHVENRTVLGDALSRIDDLGLAAGLAVRVETPLDEATPWLPRLRFLTLLGTEIGVKGKGLDPTATSRLQAARTLIAGAGLADALTLASDGGNRESTVPELRRSGADTVVLGSLAFGAPDLAARIAWAHGLPGPDGTAR